MNFQQARECLEQAKNAIFEVEKQFEIYSDIRTAAYKLRVEIAYFANRVQNETDPEDITKMDKKFSESYGYVIDGLERD